MRTLPTTGEWIWLSGFVGSIVIRTPHAIANRRNRTVADRHGFGERLLLAGMFATMMILSLADIVTPFLDFAVYTLAPWTVWFGAVLQAGYCWLFWRSHSDLGRNWSPGLEVREGHELVTWGVYGRIRHPMYAAIWLGAAAQALLIQNWIAGLLVLPAFALMYVFRVPREEAMMEAEFGEAYVDYKARTGRIWPKLAVTDS